MGNDEVQEPRQIAVDDRGTENRNGNWCRYENQPECSGSEDVERHNIMNKSGEFVLGKGVTCMHKLTKDTPLSTKYTKNVTLELL